MRVLIGCERSGVIRRAFRAKGHDAWSCDLEDAEDKSPHHIKGDVLEFLDGRVSRYAIIGIHPWDAAIFNPDCTFLSASGLHWTTRGLRDKQKTEDALYFVCRLLNCRIPKIALENPTGCISTRIRLYAGTYTVLSEPDKRNKFEPQYIQPYNFGEDASKKTGLWLKNLPELKPTKYVKPRLVCTKCKFHNLYDAAFGNGCTNCGADTGQLKPRWANQTDSGQNKLGPSETRAMDRARTYPGIAAAMAEQWGSL